MIKKNIFKQGIGIAEKSQGIAGVVMQTTNAYFDSIKIFTDHWVKTGICGLHYHSSNPFLFLGFFQRSLYSLFEYFIFFIIL